MMPKFWTLIFSIILLMSSSQAAVFNRPSGLINIPIAKFYIPGDLVYGASMGVYDNASFEFDYQLHYALTETFQLGITAINTDRLVSNVHWTFFELEDAEYPVRVGAGLLNISGKRNLSTWQEYETFRANNFGHYVVASVPVEQRHELHVGLSRKHMDIREFGDQGDLHTLFFGWQGRWDQWTWMAEYDGSDVNLGMRYQYNDQVGLSVAVPGVFGIDVLTPEAPRRNITFAMTLKSNVFDLYKKKHREVKKRVKAVDAMSASLSEIYADLLARYESLSLPTVAMTPEEIRRRKAALALYDQSYDAFVAGYLPFAIDLLKKAVDLDPKNVAIHNRLGSYYYVQGAYDQAMLEWQVSIALDPFNKDIWQLPRPVLEQLRQPDFFELPKQRLPKPIDVGVTPEAQRSSLGA